MKETTKIRIGALIAAILLAGLCLAFGQDVKARSFRDELKLEYDANHYFNLALIISSGGEVEQTDSIHILIHERDSLTASMFTVCEKTNLYLAYDRFYLISIRRRGYSTAQLIVNSGVLVKEYDTYVHIPLEKSNAVKSIGIVVWDSRINDVHYYPEPGDFR